MFKYSCFIENSEEARESLNILGYIQSIFYDITHKYIITDSENNIFYSLKEGDKDILSEVIDCSGNLPLFKALTAVRDDSDYMQHFTDGIDWVFCEAETVKIIALCHFMNNNERVLRKATKEELIEHFKKEK